MLEANFVDPRFHALACLTNRGVSLPVPSTSWSGSVREIDGNAKASPRCKISPRTPRSFGPSRRTPIPAAVPGQASGRQPSPLSRLLVTLDTCFFERIDQCVQLCSIVNLRLHREGRGTAETLNLALAPSRRAVLRRHGPDEPVRRPPRAISGSDLHSRINLTGARTTNWSASPDHVSPDSPRISSVILIVQA
jgi:hypothetical protein